MNIEKIAIYGIRLHEPSAKALIPHLKIVPESDPVVYELVLDRIGALQLYIKVEDHGIVTCDYYSDQGRPQLVFYDIKRLFLNQDGVIVNASFES